MPPAPEGRAGHERRRRRTCSTPPTASSGSTGTAGTSRRIVGTLMVEPDGVTVTPGRQGLPHGARLDDRRDVGVLRARTPRGPGPASSTTRRRPHRLLEPRDHGVRAGTGGRDGRARGRRQGTRRRGGCHRRGRHRPGLVQLTLAADRPSRPRRRGRTSYAAGRRRGQAGRASRARARPDVTHLDRAQLGRGRVLVRHGRRVRVPAEGGGARPARRSSRPTVRRRRKRSRSMAKRSSGSSIPTRRTADAASSSEPGCGIRFGPAGVEDRGQPSRTGGPERLAVGVDVAASAVDHARPRSPQQCVTGRGQRGPEAARRRRRARSRPRHCRRPACQPSLTAALSPSVRCDTTSTSRSCARARTASGSPAVTTTVRGSGRWPVTDSSVRRRSSGRRNVVDHDERIHAGSMAEPSVTPRMIRPLGGAAVA